MQYKIRTYSRALSILAVVPVVASVIATAAELPPQVVTIPQVVLPLPGHLDGVPVLNSNSPEVVQQEGILVSTLPPPGKKTPSAHLNYAFNGRFDVFLHHIARSDSGDLTTLYVSVVLANTGSRPVAVDVLQAASYLSQPDAPFIDLPPYSKNDSGEIYSGPGDRVTSDVLRGLRQDGWPASIKVPAHGFALLANLPIPVYGLTPALNGRSLLARLNAHGNIYAATMAAFARKNADGSERAPALEEWRDLLVNGALAGPRERPPSIPGAPGAVAYGRVAGVALGSRWNGALTSSAKAHSFELTDECITTSYPISSVAQGTLGTGQIQSAELAVREPDTAYAAHGNYGIEYRLQARLVNRAHNPHVVSVKFQTPLKKNDMRQSLSFYSQPNNRVFFRGTLKVQFVDDSGSKVERYVHVVQHQGEPGQPLFKLCLKPGESRDVGLTLIYPPDSTPPQAVTVDTAAAP